MKQQQTVSSFIALHKNAVALGVFALLIVAFYGNTLLSDGFAFDDIVQIEQNPYVQSLKYLPKTILSCQWEYPNKGCMGRVLYYRPPFFVSSILTYQISPNPWAFHLVSLLYFLLIVHLIFLIMKAITKQFVPSLAAALLFLAHPILTETVDWIAAGTELTLALFALLAVLFYIRYRQSKSRKNLLFVYLWYFFAILSKEQGILLPLLFLLADLVLFRIPVKQLLRWSEIKNYVWFAVPFAVYMFMRISVIGFALGGGFMQWTFSERVYVGITLFTKYVSKIFYPYPLALFPPFERGPDFLSLSFLLSAGVIILFTASILFFIKKRQNMMAFSLLWFSLFLLPVLIFLDAVGEHVFSERYLFLPTVGFALAGGYAFSFLIKTYPSLFLKTPQRFFWIISLVFLVGAAWFLIYERNKDWKNNETISLKTLEQNPNAHPVRSQLGLWYVRRGEGEKGKEQLEELIKRAPDWKDITMAYKGLGDYYRIQGDEEQTLAYYVKATETGFSPRDYVVYNDVGVIYMDRGEYLKGFSYFCRSLQLLLENEATQQNFESSLAAIEAEYIKSGTLYEAIQEQFAKAPTQKIEFLDTKCGEESCQYAFAFRGDQQIEALPPFLIAAQTQAGKEVAILNKGFDQAASVIVLEVSSALQNKAMTVVFPSCGGVYYEAASTST